MTSWYSEAVEACKHCSRSDYQAGFGPRTLLICEACLTAGAHLECEESATGITFTEDIINAGHTWYCSEGCEKVATGLSALCGRRIRIDGNYSLEFAPAYNAKDKGNANTVDTAHRLFRQCFDTLTMDNGQDLIQMICTNYESPDAEEGDDDGEAQYNYSSFRVVVLRKGSVCVSAATIRVFGTSFAEMPFVATREGYRREGNLRRLVQGIEERLRAAGVQWLVVPSVRGLLPMWTNRFGCQRLTLAEAQALDSRIVSPDPESAQLLKKALQPACEAAGARAHPSAEPGAVGPQAAPAAAEAAGSGHRNTPPSSIPVALQLEEKAAEPVPQSASHNDPGQVLASADIPAAGTCKDSAPPELSCTPSKQDGRVEGPFPMPEIPGWSKTVRWRPGGKGTYSNYTSPSGRTFRSFKQACAHAEELAASAGQQPAQADAASKEPGDDSGGVPGPSSSNSQERAGACSAQTRQQKPASTAGSMPPPPPRLPRGRSSTKPAELQRPAGAAGRVPVLALRKTNPTRLTRLDAAVARTISEAVHNFLTETHREALATIARLTKEDEKRRSGAQASTPSCSPPPASCTAAPNFAAAALGTLPPTSLPQDATTQQCGCLQRLPALPAGGPACSTPACSGAAIAAEDHLLQVGPTESPPPAHNMSQLPLPAAAEPVVFAEQVKEQQQQQHAGKRGSASHGSGLRLQWQRGRRQKVQRDDGVHAAAPGQLCA